METSFVSLLALERCEVNIAQICALAHITSDDRGEAPSEQHVNNIIYIARNIARDVALLREMADRHQTGKPSADHS